MISRTDYEMKVVFEHPETGEKEEVEVYIPDDVFYEAFVNYAHNFLDVDIDARTKDIIYMLAILEANFDEIADSEPFLELCKERYEESPAKDEDFENWVEDYNFEHSLGDYADEA